MVNKDLHKSGPNCAVVTLHQYLLLSDSQLQQLYGVRIDAVRRFAHLSLFRQLA